MEIIDTITQLKPFLSLYLLEQGIDTSKAFSCINPKHKDKNPSCNLIGADTNNPRFYCFSCNLSGDIFDAVHLIENKGIAGFDWIENTLKYLASKYNIEVPAINLSEDQIYKLDIQKAYNIAAKFLTVPADNITIQAELVKRNWHSKKLGQYLVGTVTSFQDFRTNLEEHGFNPSFLDEIELGRKDIFNPDNIIFAWRDPKGRVIGFTSRDILWESKKQTNRDFKGPKYNNIKTSGLKYNIFEKGKRLYGIDEAIKDLTLPVYIFEGQADVITARHHGLLNCVAIAGCSLKEDHIHLLKSLHVNKICLCLDGDAASKTKDALKILAGNRDLDIRVVILPKDQDPDSFLKQHGIEVFMHLAHWTAFEWRLNQFTDKDDDTVICKYMIPFIVNESSPIVRDKLCKILSKRTGVSVKIIVEELNILLDEKTYQKSKERQDVINKLTYELKGNPSDAETIITKMLSSLQDLSKKHNTDAFSEEDFVQALDIQKSTEEAAAFANTGFKLGADLKDLEDIFRGNWSEGNFICFGGSPGTGKSAFLAKLAYCIAEHNQDVVVIYHSIDDTREQLVPRFVCLADGSQQLTINMVRQPKYWSDHLGLDFVEPKRNNGYQIIKQIALDGRLVVKDIEHGSSLPFAENLISYYQGKYPDRRIIYILDNFHKLRDFTGMKDERVRFKAMSEAIKGISLRKKCCIISSIEYTKLAAGVKPTNYNISESVQISYDATAIVHLYSEVADIPEGFNVCHHGIDWSGKKVYLPRVQFIIGKNKITDQKGSFFLDFWPASSDYKPVNHKIVLGDAKSMKELKSTTEFNLNSLYTEDEDLKELY